MLLNKEKEIRIKIKPWVSANLPSNNWTLTNDFLCCMEDSWCVSNWKQRKAWEKLFISKRKIQSKIVVSKCWQTAEVRKIFKLLGIFYFEVFHLTISQSKH